ncbi:hypothetical protein GHT09_010007 [Marmota monax]|uniref:Uncharacterized protein n=1 Tax=Marmota monax TaxID=9995 RepID=A0A834V0X8_MARMO|nr:hypothetical protein GHT09_010007 [Marmota monax]
MSMASGVRRDSGCGLAGDSGLVHFSAGRSGPMAQVVLVAIGEVAVKILLLGLCLILLRSALPRGGEEVWAGQASGTESQSPSAGDPRGQERVLGPWTIAVCPQFWPNVGEVGLIKEGFRPGLLGFPQSPPAPDSDRAGTTAHCTQAAP